MGGSETPVIRFGVFELDLKSGELRKGGTLVKLQPQPFKVLALLARHPGQLVTREEIQRQIWGSETFVDFERGLNFCIKQIRAALGDDAETPRYIETLPRRGYRLIVPVKQVDEVPLRRGAGSASSAPGKPERPRVSAPKLYRGQVWGAAFVLALVLAGLAYLVKDRVWLGTDPYGGKIMLVVLPFDNLSTDPEQDYFSQGLTEELITQLGRLKPERLGVIASTTAAQVKGESIAEIGRRLRVHYLVKGSVLRAGDRVRISAQLIQIGDQTHLWAQSYERELEDVLAIHREVSQRIADSLQLELLPAQQAALAATSTPDFETFEAYLKGRHFLKKRTPEGFEKALAYFQQALGKDSDYALAYAGLADTYVLLGSTQYGPVLPPREAMPRAKAAVLRALEIDNTLVEAHTTLAQLRLEYDWDWSGAENTFKHAIALNPSYPTAHRWYSLQLAKMGRTEESFAAISRAKALDPLSSIVNVGVGWHFYLARQYDRAIDQLKETLEMEPNFPLGHFVLGMTYQQLEREEEAIAEFQQAVELSGGSPPTVAGLGRGYALAGNKREGQGILNQLKKLSEQRYVSGVFLAAIHTALGEKEQAFHQLEKAYEDRADYMTYLKVEPTFDSLRADPRFQELLRRMNFPE